MLDIEYYKKAKYHVVDTIKHVSTLQTLFLKLLENDDDPMNFISIVNSLQTIFEDEDLASRQDSLGIILRNTKKRRHVECYTIKELGMRMLSHDRSKLCGIEYEGYMEVVYKLNGLEYGTPEHKKAIKELDGPFRYHYSTNKHHVEHYDNGFDDFDIFDLTEMILDWCSACTCRGFDFRLSSVISNQNKMGFDDFLRDMIIHNIELILPKDKIVYDI